MDQAHNMHEGCLPGSTGTDQEDKVTTLEREVDIVQDLRPLAIAHGNLFKLQHSADNRDGGKRNDCGVYTLRLINPVNSQPLRERRLPGLL